jgi:hypothetical protein
VSRNLVVYGKHFTTSHVFTHVLRRLFATRADRLDDVHVHCVFDDRRDADEARALLPSSRVTVHAEYGAMDPFASREWPQATIDDWECRYGEPHLGRYLDGERVLAGHDERTRWTYLLSHLEGYDRLSRTLAPAVFVCGAASTIHPWMAMEVFRRNGARCVSFFPTRFGETSFILESAYETLGIAKEYAALLVAGLSDVEDRAARAVADTYRRDSFRPVDFTFVNALRTRMLPNPVNALRIARECLRTDRRYYDEPLGTLVRRAVQARRRPFYDLWLRGRLATTVDRTEPFFFFPLQFEPEMALAVQGRGWTDQLEVIRLIHDSLPVDRRLYVKEHPNMPPGARSVRFYRELLRLPRVRVLDRRVSSYAVVPHAEAVLTITSTAGWEALMLGRPVALFGHAFYEEFGEGVVQVTNPEDLPGILRAFRDWKGFGDAILAYVATVLRHAAPGMMIEPRYFPAAASLVLSDDNLDKMGRVILDALAASMRPRD